MINFSNFMTLTDLKTRVFKKDRATVTYLPLNQVLYLYKKAKSFNITGPCERDNSADWVLFPQAKDYFKALRTKTFPDVFEVYYKPFKKLQTVQNLNWDFKKRKKVFSLQGRFANPMKAYLHPKKCFHFRHEPQDLQALLINISVPSPISVLDYLNTTSHLLNFLKNYIFLPAYANFPIYLLVCSKAYSWHTYVVFDLKPPDVSLTWKEFFFFIAIPDTLRRLFFLVYEVLDFYKIGRTTLGTYGNSISIDSKEIAKPLKTFLHLKRLNIINIQDFIILEGSNPDITFEQNLKKATNFRYSI